MDLTWPRGPLGDMRPLPGRQQGMTRCLPRTAEVVMSKGKCEQWTMEAAIGSQSREIAGSLWPEGPSRVRAGQSRGVSTATLTQAELLGRGLAGSLGPRPCHPLAWALE